MEPNCGGIIAFFVRFSGATNTPKVAYKLEGGQRVVLPGIVEPLPNEIRMSIGYDMEEEIKARIAR